MAEIAEAYLDGEPLNDLESFSWGLSEGVSPMTAQIIVPKSQGERLLTTARNKAASTNPFLPLVLIYPGRQPEQFNNVLITGWSPSTFEPLSFMLLNLSDNRWYWERGHYESSFNMRTAVGDKDSIDEVYSETLGTVPRETINKISYRSYSLYPPIRSREGTEELTTWTIPQILEEIILGESEQSMKSTYRHNVEADLTAKVLRDLADQLYEGIPLNGSHRTVLSQLLSTYIPHVGIYVDRFGVIKFYDKSQGEDQLISGLSTPIETDGKIEFVRNEIGIARKINVIFDIQSELRFDFEEVDEGSSVVPNLEGRTLSMIAPNPDITLDLPNGTTALAQQPVEFNTLIQALQTKYPDIPLSKSLFRRFYCFPGIIESFLFRGKVRYPNIDWGEVVSTLKNSYRKRYRINGNWQSKMVGIKDRRVTVFDPTTGTLAPSPVFQDYAYWLSTKGVFSFGPEFETFIQNVTNWSSAGYKVNDAVPMSLAEIYMGDAENGIFTLQLNAFDPVGHYKSIYPSTIENAPSYNFGDQSVVHYADEASADGQFMALSKNHRMATIISATPAPHPGKSRYFVTIEPSQVSNIIPTSKLDGALGEEIWVKIPASAEMARIRWKDGLETEFEQLFGVGTRPEKFPDLLVQQIINRKYLEETARAVSASIWAQQIHRYKGSQTMLLESGLDLAGAVSSVIHTMESNGLLSTKVHLDEQLDVPSFENFLSPETRAFILGQVKQDA